MSGNHENKPRLDLEAIRHKLASSHGKTYWRSLEELEETDEFKQWLDDEFPHRASLPDVDRRSFIKLMGASLALAGLAGCRNLPQEKIIPYVKAPEERYPGQLLAYATAMAFGGYGFGLVVTSSEGRPIKAEGNPDHPASLGSTDLFAQAELLQMYDPDRSEIPMKGGLPGTWESFLAEARSELADSKGAGVRILAETVTSPTLYALMQQFKKSYPGVRWHQFNTVNRDSERLGSSLAFNQIVDTHYDFAKAKVVLSLDGDFLDCSPRNVRHIRDFSSGRNPESGAMNRLYAVESMFSTTGAYADHRCVAKPSEIEDIARYLASHVGAEGGPGKLPSSVTAKWIDGATQDLISNRGASIVITSERQPAAVHALVHAINKALGNIGSTVNYAEPVEFEPVIQHEDLKGLAADMKAGAVKTLIILGGNPVYSAPPDIQFDLALAKVGKTIHLSQYRDETSELCHWHLPESHFLEAWGDIRGYDGTTSIVQPLISPLFDTKNAIELIAALLGKTESGYDLVRSSYVGSMTEHQWRDALNRGTVEGTTAKPKSPSLSAGFSSKRSGLQSGGVEAVFAPDPNVHDGRYNNNGWLQELPKVLTKLCWDNAVIMGPKMAVDLGVVYQDIVTVGRNAASVDAPVFVLPGQPDGVITLHLGYGRTKSGKVGNGTGHDFNVLRSSATPWHSVVEIKKGTGTKDLATTQAHHSMEHRDIVREGDFEEFQKNPNFDEHDVNDERRKDAILYNLSEDWTKETAAERVPQWAMVIDLNLCIGCNACTIACQAENNIPTVGKDQVQRGRVMHWIRVDRYFRVEDSATHKPRDFKEPISQVEAIAPQGDPDALSPGAIMSVPMPVPCMHCETAPCEPVCPVAATIHNHEGLNQMVYNRCVGTRYCSNNCPYKVRRFNFYNYQFRQKNFSDEKDIPLLKLMNNPDVTVRGRGVMEKCTYCVQRLNRARIEAKKEDRDIRDKDVVPACAQACPTKAIVLGNLLDPSAAVAKQRASKRNYSLLDDLNTRPRTTYLAKVRNVNREVSG